MKIKEKRLTSEYLDELEGSDEAPLAVYVVAAALIISVPVGVVVGIGYWIWRLAHG